MPFWNEPGLVSLSMRIMWMFCRKSIIKVPRRGIWYWVVVSIFFIFTPILGDMIQFDYFFQMGWNHQLGFFNYFQKNYLNWSCFLPSFPSSSLRWGRRNSCEQSTCSVSDWMVDRIRTCWNEFCRTRNEHVTTTIEFSWNQHSLWICRVYHPQKEILKLIF